MPSAPMRYLPDGNVDWGNMWDSFCELALDGGPPHRADLLAATAGTDPDNPAYQVAVAEIVRGVVAVSGFAASAGEAGWVAISCPAAGMAPWLAEAIVAENVTARAEGRTLLVPVAADYGVEKEIKNVVTAVAKTTHYWREHLPVAVKQALALQERLGRLRRLFGR